MEVQGNGVPQAWHQHTELPFVQINAADLVAVGENDKRLERICGYEQATVMTFITRETDQVPNS